MAWMFERTVEVAAWVAMVVAWASLGFAIYWFYQFVATANSDPNYEYLRYTTQSAGAFVGFSLALGGLACVDRFLFDADQPVS